MPFLFLIMFSVMAGFAVLLPTIVYHLENLGATSAEATQILACYSFAQFFSGTLLGRLSDRLGRKPVLVAGLFGAFAAYGFLHLYAFDLVSTLVGLVLAGFSSGIVAVIFASVTDMTLPENRAKGMGAMGAGIGLAFTLGPAIGAFLGAANATEATIQTPVLASLGFVVLGLLSAIRLKIVVLSTDNQEEEIGGWKLVEAKPVLMQMAFLMFLFTATTALTEPIMPLLLDYRYGWGPKELGTVFGYVGLIIILVQGGLVGPLARRYGERNLVVTGVLLQFVGLMILIYTPVSFGIFVGLAFTSVGGALFNTNVLAIASMQARESRRGVILGAFQSMMSVGRSTGPLAAGLLFTMNPDMPMFVGSAVSVVVLMWLVSLLWISREHLKLASDD